MRLHVPPLSDGSMPEHALPARSRRLGGLVVEVDLNRDRTCNWRCVYCDVDGLAEGSARDPDPGALEAELTAAFTEARSGRWPRAEAGPLRGVMISGRGEPTSVFEFDRAVAAVARARESAGATDARLVLATNGTFVNKPKVRAGLGLLSEAGGEVWFKLDSATREGRARICGDDGILRQMRENLRVATQACPTWIQTTAFLWDGEPPSEAEVAAYVAFLESQLSARIPLRGVLLATLDAPSAQPGAGTLRAAPRDWLDGFADRIRATGAACDVFA